MIRYTGLSLTYHLDHSVLNVINASLPPIPVCVVFPKVLFWPLLFIMYTTPLSTLISSLSLNHHLYTTHSARNLHVGFIFDKHLIF